jgi:predicted transcriptional regulator
MRRTEYFAEKHPFYSLTAQVLMEQDVVVCRSSDSARHITLQLTKYNVGVCRSLMIRGPY